MKTTRQAMPIDCLLDGRVHPSVAERLERVQQIPVAAVVNFLGIHPSPNGLDLVWQAVDAKPLAELDFAALQQPQRQSIFDQLQQAVVAMHAHGIVHGSISLQTVMLDSAGKIHLTHISPLLYDDPEIDLAAVRSLRSLLDDKMLTPSLDNAPSLKRIRAQQHLLAGLSLVAGTLIFVVLVWYSLAR